MARGVRGHRDASRGGVGVGVRGKDGGVTSQTSSRSAGLPSTQNHLTLLADGEMGLATAHLGWGFA